MKKRGQVTLFIVLGIIILILAGSSFFYKNPNNESQGAFDITPIKSLTESCIKKTIEYALPSVGFSNLTALELNLNQNLRSCTNQFVDFQDMTVVDKAPNSNIILTTDNKTLIIELDYELKIKKQDLISKISKFSISYPLENSVRIQLSQDGTTTTKNKIVSRDNQAQIIIDQGTKVISSNNQPVNEIKVVLNDQEKLMDWPSSLLLGEVLYDFEPDGVSFDKPVHLIIHYNDSELPSTISESLLVIMSYDGGTGSWIELPTTVNTQENIAYADINHFSFYAVGASCFSNNGKNIMYWKPGNGELRARWPSFLHWYCGVGNGGCGRFSDSTTYTKANGVDIPFYKIDCDNGAKPSYIKDMSVSSFPTNTVAELYEDGEAIAKITIPNPREKIKYSFNSVTLSEECHRKVVANCGREGYSGTPLEGNDNTPSSPTVCEKNKEKHGGLSWDYGLNQECPGGFVNCDDNEGCSAVNTECSQCPIETEYREGYSGTPLKGNDDTPSSPTVCEENKEKHGGLSWDYDLNQECPGGFVNCDDNEGCSAVNTECSQCPIETG
jgi:hypothetical protein